MELEKVQRLCTGEDRGPWNILRRKGPGRIFALKQCYEYTVLLAA